MQLDPDLRAIKDKVDRTGDAGPNAAFEANEQRLITDALARSQKARHGYTGAAGFGLFSESKGRELDFFMVCLGYCLVAFALLAMLAWWDNTPPDNGSLFGLAYLTGLSATVFYFFYQRGSTAQLLPIVAALVLVLAVIGLLATGAIGVVFGLILGPAFFYAHRRHQLVRRTNSTSAGETGTPSQS